MTFPTDGRMTSFTELSGSLNGDELFWIVSPGNASQGVLYKITATTLGAFFASFATLNTVTVTSGATITNPYQVLTTDTRILFNKTVGAASYAVLPTAISMAGKQPVLFKDLKGDASTNNITITFSAGELCEGLSSIVVSSDYGWTTINPIPAGGGWFLT